MELENDLQNQEQPIIEGEQGEAMPPVQEEEKLDLATYTIDAKFSDEEKKEVVQIVREEMTRINSEYQDEGYLNKCEVADDEYEAVHDESVSSDDPDVKLLLTTITIDIIASRAYRQTWTPAPCVIMEAEYDTQGKEEDLFKRQDSLDYYLRNKSKLQDLSLPVYRAAGKYGAAVLKTCFDHSEESFTSKKVYRTGNQRDIERFQKKYGKKIINPESKEYAEFQQLVNGGEPVVKKETENIVYRHGAKHYRVNWKNFFARPSIKDFKKHIVKAELFVYNWYEVEQRAGFWDEQAINRIKGEYADKDLYTLDFDFYEAELLYKRKDKLERYLVTYESKTEEIVRAIYYPYKKEMYTAYCVFERDDSWIGYSITERMADIVATANSTINSYIGEQALAHTPVIIGIGRKQGDWTIKLGKPNLLPIDASQMMQGTNPMMQYRMETPSTDRIQFLQWIFMYIAVLTGIDLIQSAGASDPQEKNPTNLRTQIKQIASTIRVEDMIVSLQKGDVAVWEQVEDIVYRFPESYKSSEYKWFKGGQAQEFDLSIVEMPVRYVAAGSRMSFDRNMDLQAIMTTIDFLSKYFPEELMDVDVKKSLLNALLNNTQGTIEKIKDTLMKPYDMIIEAKKKSEEQLKMAVEQARAQGQDPSEFLKMQMMGPGPQGGGTPPAGAPPPNPVPGGMPQ